MEVGEPKTIPLIKHKPVTSVTIYFSSGDRESHRLGNLIFGDKRVDSIIVDAGGSVISVALLDIEKNIMKRTYCREIDIFY